jgi:hypothetical protein
MLCDDCKGDVGREEEKDEREPKPVSSFAEAYAAFQMLKQFSRFYCFPTLFLQKWWIEASLYTWSTYFNHLPCMLIK